VQQRSPNGSGVWLECSRWITIASLQFLRLTTDELQYVRMFDGCKLRSICRDLEEDAVDDPDKAKLLEGANGDPEVVQDRVRSFVANPDAVLTLT